MAQRRSQGGKDLATTTALVILAAASTAAVAWILGAPSPGYASGDEIKSTAGLVMWASLHALLTAVPAYVVLGTRGADWERVFFRFAPRNADETRVLYSSLGACAGAWSGATVFPLDWDTWWQRWPLPLVCGSVVGGVVGYAGARACT